LRLGKPSLTKKKIDILIYKKPVEGFSAFYNDLKNNKGIPERFWQKMKFFEACQKRA